MVYIEPEDEEFDELSLKSDIALLNVSITLLCKGQAQEKLINRVFAYSDAFYQTLRENQSLGGFVDASRLISLDYYPAVTASKHIVAIEYKLQIQWTKDF